MIEPFSKYIRLNSTTWTASRNSACRCSIHKLVFHIFLGNTTNGGTYVPVAFIQAITLPMLEATSFLPIMMTTLLCLCCTAVIPLSSTVNILWTGWLTFLSSDSYLSKKLCYFSDVKPFTRAAEMPSGVVTDITGCLFKKDRSHLFPVSDFSWLSGCFKPFLNANWKAMRFMSWRLSP